jgi:hypothetical protein
MMPNVVESKLFCDFHWVHSIRQILLVRIYQNHCISEFVCPKKSSQLVSGFRDAVSVTRVDDKDDAMRAVIICDPSETDVIERGFTMLPETTDLILPSNIPNCEIDLSISDCFDIEAWSH